MPFGISKVWGWVILAGIVVAAITAVFAWDKVRIAGIEARAEARIVAELTAATNQAVMELSDEADRHKVKRRFCRERGGMFDFATGRCIGVEDDTGANRESNRWNFLDWSRW